MTDSGTTAVSAA